MPCAGFRANDRPAKTGGVSKCTKIFLSDFPRGFDITMNQGLQSAAALTVGNEDVIALVLQDGDRGFRDLRLDIVGIEIDEIDYDRLAPLGFWVQPRRLALAMKGRRASSGSRR